MGLHVAQMTSQKGVRACFDAVTTSAAKVMHLKEYGIEAGCDASFVLLQARDTIEAIRLRANRLKVWRRGRYWPRATLSRACCACRGVRARPPSHRADSVHRSLWSGFRFETGRPARLARHRVSRSTVSRSSLAYLSAVGHGVRSNRPRRYRRDPAYLRSLSHFAQPGGGPVLEAWRWAPSMRWPPGTHAALGSLQHWW
jgi:hypothetical protein